MEEHIPLNAGRKERTVTNFERIRAMSREQLAQNLAKMAHDAMWFDTVCRNVCEACGNHTPSGCRYDLEIYDCEYVSDDKALFLRWLELESEV